jgi:hypothetical protein
MGAVHGMQSQLRELLTFIKAGPLIFIITLIRGMKNYDDDDDNK